MGRFTLSMSIILSIVLFSLSPGLAQDEQSVDQIIQAAEQGYANAQGSLGYLYEKGHGVTQDYGKAMEWYRKAAAQDANPARKALGRMYENGLGIQKDLVQAAEWYEKAEGFGGVKENLKDIYFRLGVMSANGKEVKK